MSSWKFCLHFILLFSKPVLCHISASSSCHFQFSSVMKEKFWGKEYVAEKVARKILITLCRTIFHEGTSPTIDRSNFKCTRQIRRARTRQTVGLENKKKILTALTLLTNLHDIYCYARSQIFRMTGDRFTLSSSEEYRTQVYSAQCPDHRVHTEWQLPLSGIHSIMMEKFAQPDVRGVHVPFNISTITYKVVV